MAQPGMRSAGGMNVYLRHLAPLLAQSGVCVDIFTRSHHAGGPERVDLGPRARVVHLPAGPVDAPKEAIYGYLPAFLEQMEHFAATEGLGYDLIHSHYWFSGWVGQRIAASWGVPRIVTFHTLALVKQMAGGADEPLERRQAELELAGTADGVVAFSSGERDALVNIYGASPGRIHVVPGGVDINRFRPGPQQATRQRLGLDPGDRIILYVGRLDPFKGPELLLRSFGLLPSALRARLLFVGGEGQGDPEAQRLHQIAEQLGIAARVHWQSAVPQEQLVDYYNAADLLAMPSYHESFGLVALEAMACGLPVVASRVGALASLVMDGQTGRLVGTHEPEAFARSLEDVLEDEALRNRLGRGAQIWAAQFPWSRVARQLIDVYNLAVAEVVERPEVVPCLA
jgi:D-inositol-3-phosphate glycosyltransferase